jgi:hypothetical protein
MMDATSMPKVQMPNRSGFIPDEPAGHGRGPLHAELQLTGGGSTHPTRARAQAAHAAA